VEEGEEDISAKEHFILSHQRSSWERSSDEKERDT
jgi:hypothetical protein